MSNLIEFGYEPNQVRVSEMKIDYTQDGDSVAGENIQFLTVEVTDAGAGCFFVIQTDRWAFDNIEQFVKILKDFQKRVGVKK